MKKFSPLEILALNDLPEAARLKRTAYFCRKHGWDPGTLHKSKGVLEKLGEPRGAKTRLKKALKLEFMRQTAIAKKRNGRRRANKRSFTGITDYDPVAYKLCGGLHDPIRQRTTAVCAVRIAQHWKKHKIKRSDIMPDWAGYWWSDEVDHQSFQDGAFIEGGYALLIRPRFVHTVRPDGYVDWGRHYAHNFKWLLVLAGGVLKSVRVKGQAYPLKEALDSLKTSHVKTAEKKGHDIKIDWDRELFLVKSPSRKKWRELPFKKWERERRSIKTCDDCDQQISECSC